MDPDREQLLRNLTAMAADVVKAGQTELALAWLWSRKAGEPPPTVSRGLLRVLQYVFANRYTEVEASYRGCDYFEDCMQLAMRRSQLVDLRKNQVFAKSEAVIVPTQYQ